LLSAETRWRACEEALAAAAGPKRREALATGARQKKSASRLLSAETRWRYLLEPDKKRKFILHYDLGVSEENPQVPLVPPAEKLKKLEDHALNASLIVMSGDKEIARFDLKKHK
jgi:hypothetical protein